MYFHLCQENILLDCVSFFITMRFRQSRIGGAAMYVGSRMMKSHVILWCDITELDILF